MILILVICGLGIACAMIMLFSKNMKLSYIAGILALALFALMLAMNISIHMNISLGTAVFLIFVRLIFPLAKV